MPQTQCCVPQCLNRGGHEFPRDKGRQKAWIVAIRRDHWKPTKHSVVCYSHFDREDYVGKTTSGTTPLQKKLKQTAVPHIFNWTMPESLATESRRQRLKRRTARSLFMAAPAHNGILDDSAEFYIGDFVDIAAEETVSCNSEANPDVKFAAAQTQTDIVPSMESGTQTGDQVMFSAENFVNDAPGIHFYTGLDSYQNFKFVLQTLGPAAYHLHYYDGTQPDISIDDQFFLTLIRLRRHTTNFELSRLFRLREGGVTNIFVTWVNFMFHQWNEIDWWPPRDVVKFFCPRDFKEKFPNTRVIIDGTECPIFKPKQPLAQQTTFSSYKNRNTVKVLVGCTPGGLVSYVSPAYGGSASDRQICERSNLSKMCDSGDSIMADKGFNVQDLFVPYNVQINIPSFFKAKNRMSSQNVLKDRKIASKRVHIERLIGLAKTYKIVCNPLNNTESALATEIIKVCFILCNFRNGIVPKHA